MSNSFLMELHNSKSDQSTEILWTIGSANGRKKEKENNNKTTFIVVAATKNAKLVEQPINND